MAWKKGRGALGGFAPLIGEWTAQAAGDEPASRAPCTRCLEQPWDTAFALGSKTRKGWNRFVRHLYLPTATAG